MKKLFLFSALAAAIGLASCSSDDLTVGKDGQEVTVKYSIALPAQLQSRAYGEAAQVTDLYYAVYATGDATTVLFEEKVTNAFGVSDLTEDVTLNLVTGKSYDIVFWADAAGSPYTYDKATQCIKVDYTGAKNGEEARDAFFGQVVDMKITGPVNKTVELRRPFAQLNIGTDDLSLVKPAVTKAEVKAPVYDQVNILNGNVSNQDGTTDPKVVTFALDLFPTEAFPVAHADASKTYEYMAMNYLLVNTRELVKVEMTTDDATVDALVYDNVPVQRNYRTNIYGSLLTTPTRFTVIIKPEFFTPDYEHFVPVATPAEFLSAISSGETSIVLTDDITLPDNSGNIVAGTDDIAIELNNNTLDLGNSVIGAKDGAAITISNGDVELSATVGIQTQDGGVVNFENVNLTHDIEIGNTSATSFARVTNGTVNMTNVNIKNETTAGDSGKSRLASVTNGTLNMTNVVADTELGIVVSGGTLNMDGCTINADSKAGGNGALQGAKDAVVNVKNSTFNCQYSYGFATNATTPFDMVADFENCVFTGLNPICINVPITVTFTGCKMIGLQNCIVRGGNVTFTDCEIEMNFDITDPYLATFNLDYEVVAGNFMNGNWGTGNATPMAALCLGNRYPSSYQYPTNVTFVGTNSVKCGGGRPDLYHTVYAYANEGAGLGVTFTYPVATTSFLGGKAPFYASGNIVVNGVEVNP